MSFYLIPTTRITDGDTLLPAIGKVAVHHMSFADETGAGTGTFILYGGKAVPIAAPITSITAASPAVISAKAHGLSIGDKVFLKDTDGDIGDGYGVVDAANFTVDQISLTGQNAAAAGTTGTIHEAEIIDKFSNFGTTGFGEKGVGPYFGLYMDLGTNTRGTVLYRHV